jgi:hypothetical protein
MKLKKRLKAHEENFVSIEGLYETVAALENQVEQLTAENLRLQELVKRQSSLEEHRPTTEPPVDDERPSTPSMYWDSNNTHYTEDGHPSLFNE